MGKRGGGGKMSAPSASPDSMRVKELPTLNNVYLYLVGQNSAESKHLALVKARLESFFADKTLQMTGAFHY